MREIRDRLDAYRLSFDDWLRLPDQEGLCEIVDGELLVSPAPSVGHQRVVRQLTLWLGRYLAPPDHDRLFVAPTALRLGDDTVQPDLLILPEDASPPADASAIESVPLLVVEVLSPGTAHRDLGVKKEAYAASRVAEYWIVDPVRRTVDRLVLGAAGYGEATVFGPGQAITSLALPGLAIPLDELFAL